ncbi:hypothetical protein [Haloechinothrix halophila]|uniref:hypothetical protein n=1 Tax=Haloechinothrix halophila TaxID=1069073 RepID=UPI00068802B3|nr:hypothetical protein [Haloechinothrix halophila]
MAALFRAIAIRRHGDAPERVLAVARTVMRAKKYCVLVTDGMPDLMRESSSRSVLTRISWST